MTRVPAHRIEPRARAPRLGLTVKLPLLLLGLAGCAGPVQSHTVQFEAGLPGSNGNSWLAFSVDPTSATPTSRTVYTRFGCPSGEPVDLVTHLLDTPHVRLALPHLATVRLEAVSAELVFSDQRILNGSIVCVATRSPTGVWDWSNPTLAIDGVSGRVSVPVAPREIDAISIYVDRGDVSTITLELRQ